MRSGLEVVRSGLDLRPPPAIGGCKSRRQGVPAGDRDLYDLCSKTDCDVDRLRGRKIHRGWTNYVTRGRRPRCRVAGVGCHGAEPTTVVETEVDDHAVPAGAPSPRSVRTMRSPIN